MQLFIFAYTKDFYSAVTFRVKSFRANVEIRKSYSEQVILSQTYGHIKNVLIQTKDPEPVLQHVTQ